MASTAITRMAHEEIKPNIGSRILNSKAELQQAYHELQNGTFIKHR